MKTKIVAHRGFWRSSALVQNSIASLSAAGKAAIWGSEFDIQLSADSIPVVYHDRKIAGLEIQKTEYAKLEELQIVNGEKLPVLRDYLRCAVMYPNIHLVAEIKPHDSLLRDRAAADIVLQMIRDFHLERRTDFISFSPQLCVILHELAPEASVASLSKMLSPRQVKAMGLSGVDYDYNVLRDKPQLIDEAHALSLEVNVWIVNNPAIIKRLVLKGVDYITTDNPLEAMSIVGAL